MTPTDERLVLVVEDDPDASLLCRVLLERAGFTVICATDGASGVALARSHGPAVILLDYMLPDMDGIAVLEALRSEQSISDIPVVMVTARTDAGDQLAAWEGGVSDYVTKPFESVRLLAAVRASVVVGGDPDLVRRRQEALDRLHMRDLTAIEHVASLVEHADDAIIGLSLTGRITSWNESAGRLFGYAEAEVVGQPISVLLPAGGQDELSEIVGRIGLGGHVSHFETVRQHKDGHLVEVSVSVSPIMGASGAVLGVATISRDVTVRRQSEAKFRTVVEQAPDAMVIVDEYGLIELVNRQTERIFGYGRGELVGQLVEMLIPERFRVGHSGHRADYVAAPAVRWMGAGLDLYGLRKDGSEFPVEISVSPLTTDHGVTVAAAIRDVTERKQAEARYRALVEAAPDAIVAIDTTGRIQFVNAQAEALFGYARDELLGQLVEILVTDRHRRAHPGHRLDYFAEPRTRPMGAGLDLWARRKDGTEFPVEISLSSIQIEEDVLVSAAIRDVTERKQAEARYRGLVEAAPDAMVIVDAQGRIELVNAQTERLFGYARDELVGCAVDVLVPERFRAGHPQHRLGYVAAAKVREMGAELDLYGLRKDGTEFPVEISLSPLETDQGVTVSASIRDVTGRRLSAEARTRAFQKEREAGERLRQVDRLRVDFLSTVSHELRTPLTTINGFANLLADSWPDHTEADREAYVQRIAVAGARLAHLIGDLLDFSRIETGQLVFTPEPLDLTNLVSDAVGRLGLTLGDHVLDVAVPAGLTVQADPSALERILDNLLDNATKFSPKGSRIVVSSSSAGAFVAIAVTDLGTGIPSDEVDHIFERFYRVGGRNNRRPGTGIGLAIVKEFTEAQGGRVDVRSTLGEGTTVTVLLPAC